MPVEGEDVKEATAAEDTTETKVTYKSFKKKYRKMRSKFDHTMREGQMLFREEQRSLETARRLAQENDQLLELLLDANSSAQIHGSHRIDLGVPAISAVPGLVTDYAEQAAQLRPEGEAGKTLQYEIQAILNRRKANKAPDAGKSLIQMMDTIPHRPLDIIPAELLGDLQKTESGSPPVSYLQSDQIDDYLYEIDTSLGNAGYPTLAPSINGHPHTTISEKELSFANPNSVYNWLRQHEPKIFLQDGEGSDKSSGKPGALRGAGKRASIPAPSKPDQVEFVEEDSLRYEGGIAPNAKGAAKRKREEDTGYRPKAGSSRLSKRKKSLSGESTVAKTKGKTKGPEMSPSPS